MHVHLLLSAMNRAQPIHVVAVNGFGQLSVQQVPRDPVVRTFKDVAVKPVDAVGDLDEVPLEVVLLT